MSNSTEVREHLLAQYDGEVLEADAEVYVCRLIPVIDAVEDAVGEDYAVEAEVLRSVVGGAMVPGTRFTWEVVETDTGEGVNRFAVKPLEFWNDEESAPRGEA